ncbi:MAG: iron transporter, partial [Sinomonas sp.]|nr:iron transporter [Sinomonas sp.]
LVLADGYLLLRLAHISARLRVRVARVSTVAMHRFEGPVELLADGAWTTVGLEELAELTARELTARTGITNPGFEAQVRASRDSLADILESRPLEAAREAGPSAAEFLDSEQALIGGHPRHPSPKWRSGEPAAWRRFSPETRTAFPLRWLAVPDGCVVEYVAERVIGNAAEPVVGSATDGGFDEHAMTDRLLDGASVPAGHRAVPVHPWQFELLSADPELGPVIAQALAEGALVDLGTVGLPFHPTASVRTLYQPDADVFLKTSLNVRLTNCLRKNAAYELSGAVALTALLADTVAEVQAGAPGFGLLPEPAARSVELPAHLGTGAQRLAVLEGFGSIVRGGLREAAGESSRVHLLGSLVASPDPAGTRTRLADLVPVAGSEGRAQWARDWWERYVGLLVPPVLRLWAEHGIVLEPHLQNVLAVLGPDGLPEKVLARDLEGTKLIESRHADILAALPDEVTRGAAYCEERGWNRIAYCLFVNNLAETAGALADLAPHHEGFEDELWGLLGAAVERVSEQLGRPARLRALLAGVPLPAKTNMLIRWQRVADRHAGYVPFPNPFGTVIPSGSALPVHAKLAEESR